jgi:nucleoside-diphosphate-sugar epimerase
MAGTRTLFIGGTGVISSACVGRALDAGHEVTVVNRGSSTLRPLPRDVEVLHADIRDPESVHSVLGERSFDVAAEFLAFTPEHIRTDLQLFEGRVGHYIFISSASAYQTPPQRLPITESTPLRNPFWQYSRDKIACEEVLVEAYRERDFPVTIVRPSHTYDRTMIPTSGAWTDLDRMRRGAPVIVHGDGTSLWTITHNTDFAIAFVGLLGRPEALGESFHITSDEAPTWNQIYRYLAEGLGVEADLVHVSSDSIAAAVPSLGPGLIGDKAHSMVFDNSKVKALVPEFQARVPFAKGAGEIVDWFLADPSRQRVDRDLDAAFDHLADHARAFA